MIPTKHNPYCAKKMKAKPSKAMSNEWQTIESLPNDSRLVELVDVRGRPSNGGAYLMCCYAIGVGKAGWTHWRDHVPPKSPSEVEFDAWWKGFNTSMIGRNVALAVWKAARE